jgi:hypothetical protein
MLQVKDHNNEDSSRGLQHCVLTYDVTTHKKMIMMIESGRETDRPDTDETQTQIRIFQ